MREPEPSRAEHGPGRPSGPGPERALRVGVLGAARIAEIGIVNPARLTGTRLVAVAARDRARAEAFAAAHGVERVLDSYAEVVADPDVEAIYNPLANGLHGPWNLAAIAAGKHVLSEKPFASNAEEAVEVRDAGKRAGVVVADGFHYLYHPVTRRLHELVASGELGEIERVEVTMVNCRPSRRTPGGRSSSPAGRSWTWAATASTRIACSHPWLGGDLRSWPCVAASARGCRASTSGSMSTSSSPPGRGALPVATWPARCSS